MPGPMQWTAAGLVPAIGIVPNAGQTKPGAVLEVAQVDVAQPVQQKTVRQQAPKMSPKNVVAFAKARLREVKAEIRRLKALEKERGELERLIAAAESKPSRSNIREFKRTAS